MLKIKDDVNLKELEKFGFCYVKFENAFMCPYIYAREQIVVNIIDKYIYCEDFSNFSVVNDSLDSLYDLIKAGLVEKVEESK